MAERFKARLDMLRATKRKRIKVTEAMDELRSIKISDLKEHELCLEDMFHCLCIIYGPSKFMRLSSFYQSIPLMKKSTTDQLTFKWMDTIDVKQEDRKYLIDILNVYDFTILHPQQTNEVDFLHPPVSNCLECRSKLTGHNDATVVTVFKLSGPSPAVKVTLRCTHCKINYGYNRYGSKAEGFRFYNSQQPLIEATQESYFTREVMAYQLFLANHSWVSFEGFTEAYNEAVKLISSYKPATSGSSSLFCNVPDFSDYNERTLDRRLLSDAFYWHEIECEIRERGMLSHRFTGPIDDSRNGFMDVIEEKRKGELYKHNKEDCSELCRKRGCSNFVCMDGIWKLRHPHCMFPVKASVQGFPTINYPSVCSKEPQNSTMAFCSEHATVAKEQNIPTALREYIKYCGISKDPNELVEQAELDKIDAVGSTILAGNPKSAEPNVSDAHGTTEFLKENKELLDGCRDDPAYKDVVRCSKDTGHKTKCLRKWSRGLFHFVRGGGHIDRWNPLYVSEGPGQVFILTCMYLMDRLQTIPESEWPDFILAYDNMCNLDKMLVANKPLPLPAPYDCMWMKITKVIDRLHMRNHKNPECHIKYSSDHLKQLYPQLNTPVAEQTFVWASRFKKIMGAMNRRHHFFYYHRMIVRRNAYISACYKASRDPVLPKVRGEKVGN